MRALLAFAVALSCISAAGCAAGTNSSTCVAGVSFTTSPATATIDHRATAPANQQQFSATIAPTVTPKVGCAVPEWLAKATPTWTTSDPVDIQVSSAQDVSNGTAVCTGATNGPATLTATTVFDSQTLTSTSTLTCQ